MILVAALSPLRKVEWIGFCSLIAADISSARKCVVSQAVEQGEQYWFGNASCIVCSLGFGLLAELTHTNFSCICCFYSQCMAVPCE